MASSPARVLVVEDYKPFRRFVESLLRTRPGLQLICEVSDGLEAVQMAEELKPDLILLDIGLPSLNGIEVARRILEHSPNSTILFISDNHSLDIVKEALLTGARGYLVKSDAGRQLLLAIEAVLQGKRFVSASLGAEDFSASEEQYTADHRGRKKDLVPFPPRNVAIRHEVAFYSDDAGFADGFARMAKAVLKVGNPVILIVTELHRTDILQRLRASGAAVDVGIKQRRYIELDVNETLAQIMSNGLPDSVRAEKIAGELIREVAKGSNGDPRRVAICGECAPTLLAQGDTEAAIRLEHLWDEITRNYEADTLCGYTMGAFGDRESSPLFQRICAEHSAVHGHALGY
jgi:DNA-binding NarL/FixJ family response regulator